MLGNQAGNAKNLVLKSIKKDAPKKMRLFKMYKKI